MITASIIPPSDGTFPIHVSIQLTSTDDAQRLYAALADRHVSEILAPDDADIFVDAQIRAGLVELVPEACIEQNPYIDASGAGDAFIATCQQLVEIPELE
jgi:hypothetical protein